MAADISIGSLAGSFARLMHSSMLFRGRGGPRGARGRDGKEEEKWVPCTKLGRLVQQVRRAIYLSGCIARLQ